MTVHASNLTKLLATETQFRRRAHELLKIQFPTFSYEPKLNPILSTDRLKL